LVLAILFIGGIGIGIANTFFSIVNNPAYRPKRRHLSCFDACLFLCLSFSRILFCFVFLLYMSEFDCE